MENLENTVELSGIFSNGYGVIPKKLMQDKNLTVYDKCIIAYMLSFTGGGNVCFPSYKKIAEDLRISQPTISKSLKNLSSKGYIRIEKLYPENKLKHNNKYILTFLNEASLLNDIKSRTKPNLDTHETTLRSNNNISNNNISNNNNLDTTENNLFLSVRDSFYTAFEQLYGNKPTFDSKDFKQMKDIVKRAVNTDKGSPEKILKQKLAQLYNECKNNNKFWKFTPGKLLWGWNELTSNKPVTINDAQKIFDENKKEVEKIRGKK